MFTRWFTNLAPVNTAKTQAERDAIYRFRYDVYVREFNVQRHPTADHERQMLVDDDDESPFSHHLYTGTPENVSSAVRLRLWPKGQVPERVFDHYSMNLFPNIEDLNTADVGRMMIRPTLRGKMLYPTLLLSGFEYMATVNQTDLVFLYCIPGLIKHYWKQGARMYGAHVSGIQQMVPLVIVMSDYAYLKKRGSAVAPIVKKHYGAGKNRVLDLGPFDELFEGSNVPVKVRRSQVRSDVRDAVDAMGELPAIFKNLPKESIKRLLNSGFVMDVLDGTIMTTDQAYDREVFMILEGHFVALVNERHLCTYQPGDVFGVPSFFSKDGLRGASVRATTDGKVLVLRRKFLRELTRRDPKAGFQILMNLSQVLSERLRLEFQRSTLTEKLAAYLMETTIDGITQAYNKNYFMQRLQDEMVRATRYNRELSIVLMEIDRLAEINEAHSPETGDQILSQIAQLTMQMLRTNDIFARYDTTRFAIILPETTEDAATTACEKIRQKIETLDIRPTQSEADRIPVTVTIGIGTLTKTETAQSPEDLVAQTSARLNQAQTEGPNQVRS